MLRFIGKQYRKPSGMYGKYLSKKMVRGNGIHYDILIPEMNISHDDRIFEIGYGPGDGVNRIVSVYNCFVSGIDYSEVMFKAATKRNKKHILNKKVELYLGDFLTSEIIPNYYNKVFCINVVYFWEQLEIPFVNIYEGLKKEGKLYMYMMHRDELNKVDFTKDDIFNKHTIEKIVESLNLAGFKEIHSYFNDGYYINCKK